MIYEVNFVLNLNYIAYLLLGFGLGYIMVLGVTGSYRATKLDRMKDDLAAKRINPLPPFGEQVGLV